MDLAWYIKSFITLLVVVDPIGSVPVFIHATASVPEKLHRAFALRGVAIAAGVLLFFLVCGQLLLEGLGLRLGSFQVAGGIILFLFALQMMFGESKAATEINEYDMDKGEHLQGAAFPLAMPSIASPGAILAIVVLTDNHMVSLSEQAMIAALLAIVLLLSLGLLLIAGRIISIIGTTGASVISRVAGLILATIALDSVFVGLDHLGLIALKGG
ncbi:MarC family protein [Congregibacter sp.]|uniref:MarC family protein n=1 Tax=Congregibacter sp. TaxID=2744308 RepID=UPI003F6B927D